MVLPAYAGMIPVQLDIGHGLDGAPRVCGDDPYIKGDSAKLKTCSPRMRG